jgi:bifunctional pyridoxal-dependent enzyme with beta-cystathionase and maltose regulon repressor activities
MNHPVHLLKSDEPPESIQNMPIVCSYADMEFKMSSEIKQEWVRRLSEVDLHLGYMFLPSARQAIMERISQKIGLEVKKEDFVLINSMLTLYHLVVTELTKKGDQVLIFTPTYYRFVYTLEN